MKLAFQNGVICGVDVSISRVAVAQRGASVALDSQAAIALRGGVFEMQRKYIKLFSFFI